MNRLSKTIALTVFCMLCASCAWAQTVTYPLSRVLVDLRSYPFDYVVEEACRQASGETPLAYSSIQKEFSIVFGSDTGEDDIEVGDSAWSLSLLSDDGMTVIICEVLADGSTVVVYEQHRYCLPQHLPAFETGARKSFYLVPFTLEPHKRYRFKLIYGNPWYYGYRDRDGGSAFLGSEAKDTKVTIGSVERGGTLADGKPLPNSIAPGNISPAIPVTINLLDQGESVQFVVVDNAMRPSAKAKIEGNDAFTQSGTIKIKGVTQTDPGDRNKLKIAARIIKNGQQPGRFLWTSQPFAVCADPTDFKLVGIDTKGGGYNYPTDAMKYGFAVIHTWKSDATPDTPALLDKISFYEVLAERPNRGQDWAQSPFNPQVNVPKGNGKANGWDIVSFSDIHRRPSTTLNDPPQAEEAKVVVDQKWEFICERCGIKKDQHVLAGSFTIEFLATTKNRPEYVVITTETGAGAPAGGFKSALEPGQAPKKPSEVASDLVVEQGQQKIKVTWTDNSGIETAYQISFKYGNFDWSPAAPAAANSTSYTMIPANLIRAGEKYQVRVRATNWRGNSDWVYSEERTAP